MPWPEGTEEKDELRELRKRQQKASARAHRLVEHLERETDSLRELLESYREADDVLERSRRP